MDGTTNKHKWPKKVLEVPGVPYQVIKLRDKGRKITKREMDDFVPLKGLLTVERGGFGVAYHRAATLVRPSHGMPVRISDPLFEPELELLNADGMILRGHENEMVDGMLVQHVQVWLCKAIWPSADTASA
ncbi:hypothetical protein [Janthinobacterium sp. SUN120]|uniref:hypothetical protein n=1 Tax=Janthinobacterium sp. SUN120 TaxID=3004099 RepID=UPI0025B02ADA|nr:hypothetical protein [Janthinobacterium sp. SUN120]MDN2716086.1 hypothetical protein [Janthinobacterium sp. SUN120]